MYCISPPLLHNQIYTYSNIESHKLYKHSSPHPAPHRLILLQNFLALIIAAHTSSIPITALNPPPDNASYHTTCSLVEKTSMHPTPSTTTMASSSSSPLTADSFTPLLPILNAFNHRHHNQHRLAHWWPVFRSLRRTIRNLIDDLSPTTSLSSRPSPRREAVPPRAVWLNKHFIPRAYVYAYLLPILVLNAGIEKLTKSHITQGILPTRRRQPTRPPRASPPRHPRPHSHRPLSSLLNRYSNHQATTKNQPLQ